MFDLLRDLPAAAFALESYAESMAALEQPEILLLAHRWALDAWAARKAQPSAEARVAI